MYTTHFTFVHKYILYYTIYIRIPTGHSTHYKTYLYNGYCLVQ